MVGHRYLFHFQTPHGSTDVDDKHDVLGQGREVLGSKEVYKVTIRHLQRETERDRQTNRERQTDMVNCGRKGISIGTLKPKL